MDLNKEVERIAEIYQNELKLSLKALRDTIHLSVASVHNMDFLVTWNCAHIANGEIIKKISEINYKNNINTPVICTPEELLEVDND